MRPVPFWRRYDRLLGSDPRADVRDELRFHLETKVDNLVAQGWSPKMLAKKPNDSLETFAPSNAWASA